MSKIPLLTLSGGKLSQFGGLSAVKGFRVWVHPKDGNDLVHTWKTLVGAKRGRARLARSRKYYEVEPVIAVVWDKHYNRYREVAIDRASLK